LDLGFIQVSLEGAFSFDPEINSGFDFLDPDMVINFHDLHVKGVMINPNEKVVLEGTMEI